MSHLDGAGDWQGTHELSCLLGIIAHSAYHLGEIRQMMCHLERVVHAAGNDLPRARALRRAGPPTTGIWRWGAEIVVGFTVGAHKTVERGHAIDKSHPFVNKQARSLDGGLSWQSEDFNGTRPGGRGLSADEHMGPGLRLAELVDADSAELPPKALDFAQPDFALMAARTGIGRGVISFFYVSI